MHVRKIVSGLLASIMAASLVMTNSLASASAGGKKGLIEVWDFGGLLESDEGNYQNNLKVADWNDCANLLSDGKIGPDKNMPYDIQMGDLTISAIGGDRVYSTDAAMTKNYGNVSSHGKYDYGDSYVAGGEYYCNGTGGPTRRYLVLDQVDAGDQIVLYAGRSNAGGKDYLVMQKVLEDGSLDQSIAEQKVALNGSNTKCEFIAEKDGKYKFYMTLDGASKPIYNRIEKIPAVKVSGKLDSDFELNLDGVGVRFTDLASGKITEAKLDGNTYEASLTPGHSYNAGLYNTSSYTVSNDTKSLSISDDDRREGSKVANLKLVSKNMIDFKAQVTGLENEIDKEKLEIKLVPVNITEGDTVSLLKDADGYYKGSIIPEVAYNVELIGCNDYELSDKAPIKYNDSVETSLSLVKKELMNVSGNLVTFDGDSENIIANNMEVNELSFINMDDSYEYKAKLSDNSYSIQLREGNYEVKVDGNNVRTSSHLIVGKDAVNKDVLLVSTLEKERVEYKSDLYVNKDGQGQDTFATVNEAVKYASRMDGVSSDSRVTIHLAPGLYREQVIISSPYISLVNDSNEKAEISWYYGIGYKYYSVDKSGYYNPENAFDKYEKNIPAKWGCAVLLTKNAVGFRADGVTFSSSFNSEVIDEELSDGVELSMQSDSSVRVNRNTGIDVANRASTERAAAMAIEADKAEFNKCSFISSQDTLYTGGSNLHEYFKNCIISGNTDYIFGDGNVVFDACELRWRGYTDPSPHGGYVTAAKDAAKYGYLFRSCVITENNQKNYNVGQGYLGRPWGKLAQVTFLNTLLDDESKMNKEGYFSMSGNQPENARYQEYNTKLSDGSLADTSTRKGKVLTDDEASAIKPLDYFEGYIPYYWDDVESVEFTEDPYLTDNGDINVPKPGHTLSVGYKLNSDNDASQISWYAIKPDGTTSLIKSGNVKDKTIKLTDAEVGSKIKVVVKPVLVNGIEGQEKSFTSEASVLEGYENPDGGTLDAALGEGINIFLAGDSTVKDYSVLGMYNNGKADDLGSWGEVLNQWFDNDLITVVDYAQGGRSSRTFYEEGKLNNIADKISANDYLFIQFGHNDSATSYKDRYVPLGNPDENGVYPKTEPSDGQSGTYKWYLQQYIDTAKKAGARPVLISPVSRLYYDAEGNIRPHHDSDDEANKSNTYVTAMKQLADENDVLFIDAFDMTKDMYEEAYKANVTTKPDRNAYYAMGTLTEKTHSGKMGGFMEAGLIARQIQNMDLDISKAVKAPEKVASYLLNGQTAYSVDADKKLTANGLEDDGSVKFNQYWSNYGQAIIDSVDTKRMELLAAEEKPEPETDTKTDTKTDTDTDTKTDTDIKAETGSNTDALAVADEKVSSNTEASSESVEEKKSLIRDVKTGDSSDLPFLIALALASLSILGLSANKMKRTK